MKIHPHPLPRYLALSALSLALVACGGGAGSGANTSSALSGSLIDGRIQGAQVFVDLNNDQLRTDNEPISSVTGADGRYTIDVSGLTTEELAGASLVSIVPDTALDEDDAGQTLAQAGRAGMTLVSPLSAYVNEGQKDLTDTVVSPITTLVAGAVFDDGLKIAEARQRIQHELQLAHDPMAHYVRSGDTAMRRVARATADAMGQADGMLNTTLNNAQNDMARADRFSTVTGAVRDSMAKAMADAATKSAIIGASAPLSAVEVIAKLNQAGQNADAVAAVRGLPETMGDALARRSNGRAHRIATVPQTFIVVFKPGAVAANNVASTANGIANTHSGDVNTLVPFTHVFQGFSVTVPAVAADAFLQAMSHNPNVQLVEAEQQVRRHATTTRNATGLWGLDLIDNALGQADNFYTYDDAQQGGGTTAFVVDTGILSTHSAFAGNNGPRVQTGFNALTNASGAEDDQGHGSHVAGTIGGLQTGVSSAVKLVPVKVLDSTGSGTLASVIAGLDWVSGQVAANTALQGHAVVNMSLGGGASSSLDLAAANLVAQGVPVVVAAGNSNADACNSSPAREPSVITVGAAEFSNSLLTRAYYSNFGPCVDLFAPGTGIQSVAITSNTATATLSGTSMATPHVTGWVAQLLDLASAASETVTGASVKNWVTTSATNNLLTAVGSGSPNRFLRVSDTLPTAGSGSGTGSTPPTPTTVAHIADIQGRASKAGSGWAAEAVFTVVDANASVVSGALVTAHMSANGSDYSGQCTTADNGSCSVRSNVLPKSLTSVSFAPDNITGSTVASYDASANAVTSVTVTAPSTSGGGGGGRTGTPGNAKR